MSALKEVFADFVVKIDTAKLDKASLSADKTAAALGRTGKSARVNAEKASRALNGAADKIEARMSKLGPAIMQALSVTVLAAVAKRVVTQTIQIGDAIDKASKRAGLSSDAFQEWAFVADRAGVSAGTFEMSTKKLRTEIAKLDKPTTVQAQAFKSLGLSIEDIRALAPEAAFDRVIEGLAGMGTEAERTKASVAIFGEQALNLDPILAQGTESLRDQRKQMQELGGGMSRLAVLNSASLNDALGGVKMSMVGLSSIIAERFFPVLERIVVAVSKGIKEFIDFDKKTGFIEKAMKGAAIGAGLLGVALGKSLLPALAKFAPMFLKFSGIVAAVTALALAFDDIWTGMQGGNSLTGELIEKFTEIDQRDFFAGLNNTVADIIGKFGELVDLAEKLGKMWLWVFNNVTMPVLERTLIPMIKFIGSSLKEVIGFASKAISFAGRVKSMFGSDDAASETKGSAKERRFASASDRFRDQAARLVEQKNNINMSVNVSGGDPRRVREAVSSGIDDALMSQLSSARGARGTSGGY